MNNLSQMALFLYQRLPTKLFVPGRIFADLPEATQQTEEETSSRLSSFVGQIFSWSETVGHMAKVDSMDIGSRTRMAGRSSS